MYKKQEEKRGDKKVDTAERKRKQFPCFVVGLDSGRIKLALHRYRAGRKPQTASHRHSLYVCRQTSGFISFFISQNNTHTRTVQ